MVKKTEINITEEKNTVDKTTEKASKVTGTNEVKVSTVKRKKRKVAKKKKKFSFPTVVRCPRCKANDTKVTSTPGKVQYRQCIRPICRQNFHIVGKKV